jgi:hypothetical protein
MAKGVMPSALSFLQAASRSSQVFGGSMPSFLKMSAR